MVTAERESAVVLLSGGLDSTTVAAVAKAAGYAVYALSFDYGQRHRFELQAAARVASWLGAVRHETVKVDLRAFGGSALTSDIAVPQHAVIPEAQGIPITYVPARNTIWAVASSNWTRPLLVVSACRA